MLRPAPNQKVPNQESIAERRRQAERAFRVYDHIGYEVVEAGPWEENSNGETIIDMKRSILLQDPDRPDAPPIRGKFLVIFSVIMPLEHDRLIQIYAVRDDGKESPSLSCVGIDRMEAANAALDNYDLQEYSVIGRGGWQVSGADQGKPWQYDMTLLLKSADNPEGETGRIRAIFSPDDPQNSAPLSVRVYDAMENEIGAPGKLTEMAGAMPRMDTRFSHAVSSFSGALADWREGDVADEDLPAALRGRKFPFRISSSEYGIEIELESVDGNSIVSIEMDGGIPKIMIYPPAPEGDAAPSPADQPMDEVALFVRPISKGLHLLTERTGATMEASRTEVFDNPHLKEEEAAEEVGPPAIA